ncbi:MAG: Gfo/Idh/MocA family oxidoreductase [Oscillospiraceae bacterium]|jgi:predicted dehydrogenase|nr:Gfo/Idh/MocA family oxidoreductase [Oscillospiraceae bacterium]
MEPVSVAVLGCGNRGQYYASYSKLHPEQLRIAGCADSSEIKRKKMSGEYTLPENAVFISAEELLSQPRFADAVFICTQDREHVEHAVAALEKGYHLLLEKPVSPSVSECKRLTEVARRYKKEVVVCHVLRYAPFYQTLKQLIDSGELGEIVHINSSEHIGYWHFSHSFVRGNWRNSNESSPLILAKCCHDIDTLLWLAGKPCRTVSSQGGLYWFNEKNAPDGSAKRCLDGCKVKDSCVYDVEKLYSIGFCGEGSFLLSALTQDITEKGIKDALAVSPYGRCVYYCDNNVADHQQVTIETEGGATIGFSVCAFSQECYRSIHIMGTKGEAVGSVNKNKLELIRYGREPETICLDAEESGSGHGGGDMLMIKHFIDLVRGKGGGSPALLEQSLTSHYVAFAAEESRQKGGIPIRLSD